MSSNGTKKNTNATLQRPKASTVFAAAFLAGAAAAVRTSGGACGSGATRAWSSWARGDAECARAA